MSLERSSGGLELEERWEESWLSRADADDFVLGSIAGSSGVFGLDESCEEISAANVLSLLKSLEVEAKLDEEGFGEEGAMVGYDGDQDCGSA
jgi:hypothetical protein